MNEIDRPAALPPELGAALEPMLTGGALPEGATLVYYPIVGSTNDLAAALAERGYPDSTIVIADEQVAGRGRGGHTWYSPQGAGLYASIVVDARQGETPADWPRWLTLATGVAISEGLHAACGLPVAIKWPNDLMIAPSGTVRGARKLGGILAEARSESGQLSHVIVGFGVNVQRSAFPPEISARATSLEDELGREVDRGRVLAATLGRFLTWLRRLRAGQTAAVVARWCELAVGGSGAAIEWTRDGVRLRGVTVGIDAEGALLVRAGGSTERVLGGEVAWL
jgi:BirA family transcriptional regulator, biotin operon repressor / biotin---[acetyl-CoA-carboxylase] ligase